MKFKLTHLISFVFVCSILLCAAGQTLACTCPYQDPSPSLKRVKDEKARVTAVFTAQVISIDSVKIKGTGGTKPLPNGNIEVIIPQYKRVITFKVTEVWKGAAVSEIKMIASGSNCDFHFEAGKTYLVYASGSGEALTTTSCSRTALIDTKNIRKEIKILNKLKD